MCYRYHWEGSSGSGWTNWSCLGDEPSAGDSAGSEEAGSGSGGGTSAQNPKSGCSTFVDLLLSYVNVPGVSRTAVGKAMGAILAIDGGVIYANSDDPRTDYPTDGFKEKYVAGGQDGWAWIHIMGIAGSYLAGNQSRIDR